MPKIPTPAPALDLYAKVEDLLGVKEAAPLLYNHYFHFFDTVDFDSILDVGCGSGDFLLQVKDLFAPDKMLGIDLSPVMVQKTINQGIDAQAIALCELNDTFDIVTAVFDMLNYLEKAELEHLLRCVEKRVNPGGYFLCDINTLYGFEGVAVGSFIVDDEDRFLAIDSDFESGVYQSDFTLFEASGSGYQKSKETIFQYYHTVNALCKALSSMRLIAEDEVMLYGEAADKHFLVFQKAQKGDSAIIDMGTLSQPPPHPKH